jgi:pilus assembly protein CpaC
MKLPSMSPTFAPTLLASALALIVSLPAAADGMPEAQQRAAGPVAAAAPTAAAPAVREQSVNAPGAVLSEQASAPRPHKAKAKSRAKPGPAPLVYYPTKELAITAGEIMVLPVKGKVQRLALGSAAVISTTTVDNNLLLIAEQPGATSLLVWTRAAVYAYRVQVLPKGLAETRAKVELLTRGIPGVKIEQLGNELVLSGMVHKEPLAQLYAALAGTPNLVLNLREDPGAAQTRSVLFRLHFIEVKRSLLEQIGVNWAKNAAGPTFGAIGVAKKDGVYDSIRQAERGDNLLDPNPPFVKVGPHSGGMFLGLATTITSRLNLGISNGDVRVLASPELTARSGGKARLTVGGQIPIPLAGALGATSVEYKDYGILFSVEPLIDANGVITATVKSELSQIDPAVTVAGIPGFLTRKTDSEISIKPGEMVALGGLVTSEMSNAIDRVPALSRIPLFGRLFRSDDFRNNKTELVVLLEPEIIEAGDGLAQQLRERGKGLKQEFEDKVKALQNVPDKFVPYPTDKQEK